MPTNITPAATWTSVIPVPNDGEGATAASLSAFAQPLANRGEYLKAQVDSVGVTRPVKHVADYAALKAVTGMAAQDARYVEGAGLYFFDPSATPAADNYPGIIKPGSGGGQWYLAFVGLLGTTSGIATVDATNRVAQPPHNALYDVRWWNYDGTGTVQTATAPSASWTKITISPLTFTDLQATDIVELEAEFALSTSGSNSVSIGLGQDGGSPTVFGSTIHTTTSSTPTRFALMTTRNPISPGGTTTYAVYIKPNGADDAILTGPGHFRARVWRP